MTHYWKHASASFLARLLGNPFNTLRRVYRFALIIAFCIALVSLTAPIVWSQTTTTGGVAGVVTDPSGAVVVDATVTLKDLHRGTTQDAKTNKEGSYRFDLLVPGTYSVSATSSGFQTVSRDVQVLVGQMAVGDIALSLGSAAQTVEVTAETPLLRTEGGNLSSTINEAQAANIPNPGNDITYMAQIAPGSVMNTAGGGLGNFSSYGISAVSNLFTVNGMDDNDPFLNLNNSGATNLALGQNEIQEVAVVTNGYSGEYGGLAGANINYVTRGGTNEFHGRASWYWNGRTMNANSYFNNATDTPRSFVNANQYGADFGGPILKDKLFFYVNFEGLYLVVPTSAQAVVPSAQYAAATEANIATMFPSNATVQQFYQNIFSLYAGAPGVSRAADTLPDHGCDGSEAGINQAAGTGFGTGSATNPLGAGVPCALSFFSNVSNKTHENLQAYRVDWNINSNDRAYFRLQRDHGLQATITDPINSLFNVQSDQPEWQGQLSWNHSFASGAVNQFLLSGQWYSAIFGNADSAATLAAFPTTVLFASGQFSDMGGINFDFPQGRRVTQFQASDDFSKTFGAHTLKFGVKYRQNWISNTDYSIFSSGLIVPFTLQSFFNAGTDGNTLLQQAFPTSPEQPFRLFTLGGYVEDSWRMKPNFTLSLAFRLEHYSNPVCVHNCFARPVTDFPQLSTDPTTPYNQLMRTNQAQMLPSLTTVTPQPRIGFAWSPNIWWIHNTVVRGGFGLFYDNFPGALLDGFSENVPYDPTFSVFGGPTSIISAPGDPTSLFASAAASNAAFQSGFASGASFASLSNEVPGFAAPDLAASVNNPKNPQYQKWSLEVEHQIGQNTSFNVQYVGNHGTHIYTQNSGINGCNVTGTFDTLPACNSFSGAGINPSFLTVNYAQSTGISNYNGVTVSVTHRYKSGQLQVNYSFSHAMDTVSNSGIPADAFGNTGFGATNNSMVYPQNPANPREFNYASSDYDVRHNLNANYIWELPIKRFITRGHGPDRLLNGWMVNGTIFFRTGLPFTLVDNATTSALQAGGYGSSQNLVNVFGTQLGPGGTGINCSTQFTTSPQPNASICLNPANFALSPNGFGNVSRNSIRGPDYFNTDFSLMKHTQITERLQFVLGAQFFNVLNHPNFDAPLLDVSSPRFGQILKTVSPPTTLFGSGLGADASPRLVQLKLQLVF
jgi:Carboxypeptidase regulatory-like domain